MTKVSFSESDKRTIAISQSKEQGEERKEKKIKKHRNMCNKIKRSILHVIGVSEEKRKTGTEKIFEEMMAKISRFKKKKYK